MRAVLRKLGVALHRAAARVGIHVLPAHYYSPVADLRELERTRARWARRSGMPGIRVDVEEQARALRVVCEPHRGEYEGNPHYRAAVRGDFGPGFGYIEAQALHGVVRHFRPERVIEVGSGASSYCIARALEANRAGQLTCIEPYPYPALRALPGVELVEEVVQAVPLEVFEALGDGDLLFIDSTHTVKPGGDVTHLILEVLPRLRPGVVVHFHDIYFPYDYQRDLLRTFFHWSETALLRAYLTNNERVETLFCMSQLHYDAPETLADLFPDYRPQPAADGLVEPGARGHFPASIYLRVRSVPSPLPAP